MRDGHEGEEREQPSFGCPCGLLSETSIKLSPLRMVIHPCFEQKRYLNPIRNISQIDYLIIHTKLLITAGL